jgi:Tol biopolymer transport system component
VTDRARLAFTRRQVNAPPGTPPQIYTQMVDENGQPQTKLFGPACDGHSGAWDPEGKRIVFIDPENRLCVVSVEDGRVRPLLDGATYASPSWDSLGKNIYYAADKEQNERGQRQFDLFRVAIGDDGSVAGSPQPLTTNGSLDTCPVISDERGEVYFLSNRGATSYGENSLAIFSLKMQ